MGTRKNKHEDLQPWLDCFRMFQTYEQHGMLEIQSGKNEAYVTQPALHAMSEGDDPQEQLANGAVTDTVRRIRAYALWRGDGILQQSFAVHVVKDTEPHDLIYTVLLSPRCGFMGRKDKIEVIKYAG
jgi:hypothetical protein